MLNAAASWLRPLVVTAALVGSAPSCVAAEFPLEARKLLLRTTATAGRLSGSWTTVATPVPFPSPTPADVGAWLTVRAVGTAFEASRFLPPSGWSADPTGMALRFTDLTAGRGVVVRIDQRPNGITIAVRLADFAPFPLPTTGPFEISLAFVGPVDEDVYCSACELDASRAREGFVAVRCPAPASCLTRSTTSTSSTTTTLPLDTCGNGVLDPGEQCDLPAFDPRCAEAPPELAVACVPPGEANECLCCPARCLVGVSTCCPGRRCVDTTGVGSVRLGACIAEGPCSTTADCCEPATSCTGFGCVGGACCAEAGMPCGAPTDCCSGICAGAPATCG